MPKPNSGQTVYNLPAPLSSFIGREGEIEELRRLLLQNRLITLTGAGGSGKTRLAIKVGQSLLDNFVDGVWLVELASIADPELVPKSIASALDIRERSDRPLVEIMIEHISSLRHGMPTTIPRQH